MSKFSACGGHLPRKINILRSKIVKFGIFVGYVIYSKILGFSESVGYVIYSTKSEILEVGYVIEGGHYSQYGGIHV